MENDDYIFINDYDDYLFDKIGDLFIDIRDYVIGFEKIFNENEEFMWDEFDEEMRNVELLSFRRDLERTKEKRMSKYLDERDKEDLDKYLDETPYDYKDLDNHYDIIIQ